MVAEGISFPSVLEGSRIADIGAGASSSVAHLRSLGSLAVAVDPKYANPDALVASVNGYLRNPAAASSSKKHIDTSLPENRELLKRFKKSRDAFYKSWRDEPEAYIPASATSIPLAGGSVELLYSSFALSVIGLQDYEVFMAFYNEAKRVLEPGKSMQLYPWFNPWEDGLDTLGRNQATNSYKFSQFLRQNNVSHSFRRTKRNPWKTLEIVNG